MQGGLLSWKGVRQFGVSRQNSSSETKVIFGPFLLPPRGHGDVLGRSYYSPARLQVNLGLAKLRCKPSENRVSPPGRGCRLDLSIHDG